MTANSISIEQVLGQLEPKYLSQLQAYLDYLMFLQQREMGQKPTKIITKKAKNPRLLAVQKFKGDAPFPTVTVSKFDFYEQ